VTTTFRETAAGVADGGVSGVVRKIPTTLEIEYAEDGAVDGLQKPDDGTTSASPTTGDVPFQRFDVAVGPSPSTDRSPGAEWSTQPCDVTPCVAHDRPSLEGARQRTRRH
jgi:hypothetical protein